MFKFVLENYTVIKGIFRFDTVSEYNALNNHETLHSLVSIIDFSKANPRTWGNEGKVRINYGMYCIFCWDTFTI